MGPGLNLCLSAPGPIRAVRAVRSAASLRQSFDRATRKGVTTIASPQHVGHVINGRRQRQLSKRSFRSEQARLMIRCLKRTPGGATAGW